MSESCKVTAPASSANLGPGYDVFAAALSLELELEVECTGEFAIDVCGADLPNDKSNLCVKAFAEVADASHYSFKLSSPIPVGSGLGSSAAAIVAGLVAGNEVSLAGLSKEKLLRLAVELEGHPDNVAASIYGGFVICSEVDGGVEVTQIEPPTGLEALVVIPDEKLQTVQAREAVPDQIAIEDAVFNVSKASLLTLGIARSDWDLISKGLDDRLHQPPRRDLYPRSMEIVEKARNLGALGASISGAGPTVLVWTLWDETGAVMDALKSDFGDLAEVKRLHFIPHGARVEQTRD